MKQCILLKENFTRIKDMLLTLDHCLMTRVKVQIIRTILGRISL